MNSKAETHLKVQKLLAARRGRDEAHPGVLHSFGAILATQTLVSRRREVAISNMRSNILAHYFHTAVLHGFLWELLASGTLMPANVWASRFCSPLVVPRMLKWNLTADDVANRGKGGAVLTLFTECAHDAGHGLGKFGHYPTYCHSRTTESEYFKEFSTMWPYQAWVQHCTIGVFMQNETFISISG